MGRFPILLGTQAFTLRVDKRLLKQLDAKAKDARQSRNTYITARLAELVRYWAQGLPDPIEASWKSRSTPGAL